MSWNDGYVTEVPYTYGYYPDLSPARVDLALLLAGYAPLPPGPCCELGFGQGVSLSFAAAGDPSREWWGNDFNPSHVRHARSLSAAAGVTAHLFEDSFEQFAARPDLPQFAYIALHGIWSWVSAANRDQLVEFIRRNLVPGGAVYLSYNTAAGWGPALPLRDLLLAYASRAQPVGVPPPQRMKAALDFARTVFATEPAVVGLTPSLTKRFESMLAQDPAYLTHEYLNGEWHASSFAEVAAAMERAKLNFAGTAYLLDRVPALNATETQRALLKDIADPVLRQTTRDFVTGQAFRRDLWVRGTPRVSSHAQSLAWRARRVVMAGAMPVEPIKVRGARGEGTIPDRLTTPILELLHAADQPMAIGDLEQKVLGERLSASQFADTMMLLLGTGRIESAQPQARVSAAIPHAQAMNAHLIERGGEHGYLPYLLSPVSGCGAFVPRITQLLIAGNRVGCSTTEAYVNDALRRLDEHGESISTEGKRIEDPEAIGREIARAVEEFRDITPALRRLQLL